MKHWSQQSCNEVYKQMIMQKVILLVRKNIDSSKKDFIISKFIIYNRIIIVNVDIKPIRLEREVTV